MKWYSELISDKYNSVGVNRKKLGRKPVNKEIVAEVLRLVENNPAWGLASWALSAISKCKVALWKNLAKLLIIFQPIRAL
ncbi:MAG: hypothetical protein IKD09_07415, partial [Lentisphaeria bacterium]|nr:hypothetical protein [Lentisphaeria bacterium]